jgi:threonine/homoserine/homoserine lactone efflux protein
MPFVAVSVVAFVFAFVGSLPLAGPIALLVVSSAASKRYEEARRIAFGAAVAEGIYAFLAFWGFATFLARHALVLPISHGVTAIILGGLGAYFVFSKVRRREPTASDPPKSGRFWVGFSISALNPTLLVTWGAVTTFLYSKQLFPITGVLAVPFGFFAAAGIAIWGLTMVALLKHFQLPRATLTWVVRGIGVAMIGIGLWSGVELGRYLVEPKPAPEHVSWLLLASTAGSRRNPGRQDLNETRDRADLGRARGLGSVAGGNSRVGRRPRFLRAPGRSAGPLCLGGRRARSLVHTATGPR